MEKKELDKKFFLLSLINVVPAVIFGGGATLESGFFIGALVVLVANHTILVKIVKSVTMAASGEESGGASRQATRILFLMLLKFCLLFGLVGLFYYYKRELITKLFVLIFFQLIIQVLSIKNNYQK